jgi:membrane associated rhomboid family serine protease
MNLQITGVVRNLLIINIIAFFAVTYLLPPEIKYHWFSVYYPRPGSPNFQPVQLITYMFMHGDIQHLFFNMFGLFMFGPPVEYSWGPKRFLFYYLIAGFGALALDFGVKFYQINFMNYPPEYFDMQPMVGASGAIFGLLAAYGMMYPNNVIQMLFPPIPMKAKYFVLLYAGLELYLGMSGRQAGVAHFAHLGGALFGFLLIMYWRKGGTIGRD